MRIVLILLMCVSFAYGQDTTKYFVSKDYGWNWQRGKFRGGLILPTDTTNNKLGIAQIGGNCYAWNGSYWKIIGGNTIYTGDGILSNDRTVNGNGNSIYFDSIINYKVRLNDGGGFHIDNINTGINSFYVGVDDGGYNTMQLHNPFTSGQEGFNFKTNLSNNEFKIYAISGGGNAAYYGNLSTGYTDTFATRRYADSAIAASTPIVNLQDVTDNGNTTTFDINCNQLTAVGGNAGIFDDGSMIAYDLGSGNSTLSTNGDGNLSLVDKTTNYETFATLGYGDLSTINKLTGNLIFRVDSSQLKVIQSAIPITYNKWFLNYDTTTGQIYRDTLPATGGSGTITTSGTIAVDTSDASILSRQRAAATYQTILTNPVTGTGTTNQLSYWSGTNTLGSLSTATYPSLAELSYVKGATSAIQTQIDGKQTKTLSNGNILIGNVSNVATSVTPTGDVTITNAGVTAIGVSKVTNSMLVGSIDLTTKVTGVLPLANGGTGSSTQNFVDLTNAQSIAGVKTWKSSQILNATYSALSTSATGGNLRILSSDAAASGKGGTIGLGGNATKTIINFAGISGLREDGSSDRGVLNLYTNGTANSGNPYIPRLSISSDGTVTINPTSNNVSYAIPLAVRATSGQSVNMFELRNSSGTATTVFNKFGGLVLLAGISSASGAPLKFTIGTNLTTPENGSVEYDGTDYFVTSSSTRYKLLKGLSGSYSGTGTATTTFTVTFGGTQPNSTYKVNVTSTSMLALGGYVTNKTTTTFDYILPATTGNVTFDYSLIQ